jgi:hypothetical protein
MLGVEYTSYTTLAAQILCLSEQTELFQSYPKCATIQHSYERLVVETAHSTDVIALISWYCSLCYAFSSAKGGFPQGS